MDLLINQNIFQYKGVKFMTWRGVQGRKKKLEKLYEESHRHYGGAYKDDDGRIIHRSFSKIVICQSFINVRVIKNLDK